MKHALLHNQILQAVAFIAALALLYYLRLVVFVVFIAFLLTTIIYPVVRKLCEWHWPKVFAVLVPIVAILCFLGLALYLLLPPLLARLSLFVYNLPAYVQGAAQQLHIDVNTGSLQSFLRSRFGGIGHVAFVVTSKALRLMGAAISIVVLVVYWLVSYESVQRELLSYGNAGTRKRSADVWRRIEIKLRYWIQAHLVLNTAVGLMVWIGLSIVGIPFADLLAFLAFLVEIIPTAGPLLAAAPALALGFHQSLTTGVVVGIVYIVIQQIENHLLSPLLLGRSVKLQPIVVIISLLIGVELFGLLGALLAVPVTLCISAVVDSFRNEPLDEDASLPRRFWLWIHHPKQTIKHE